ncbi:MAG: radical SAM protein [Candidatus Brocadiaceae bacterium]|nr:radical SAM protein [Candidatus Brocadiaceae bacterium]
MSVILLEHPRPKNSQRFEDVVNAPLSACLFTGYISSVLQKNKIEAEIINANLSDWTIEQTVEDLASRCFSLLCVHVIYLWERTQDVFDMLSIIKEKDAKIHVNLYGYYPAFAYRDILRHVPYIDSITIGEPEFTTLDLARSVLSGKYFSGQNIPGLASRDIGGKVTFCPRPSIQNLDLLPFPDRYESDLYRKKGIVTYIQGSRGCYGQCTFCYLNSFYGQIHQWRGRSAENIFAELCMLHDKYDIQYFYFSDANFFGPGREGKKRAIALAELIVSSNRNIRFGYECRANDVDEGTLSRLVMAGLTHVFLGLESGDKASLRRFKKHITPDENKRAIQLLRKYGIEPTFGFIMFEPNATLKSIRNNFEFLKEMEIMTTPAVTAHLLHHRQILFQGTRDYQSAIRATEFNDTLFNYEAMYEIHDPKIEKLSGIISGMCRNALLLLPETFNCVANTHNTSFLKDLNNNLIIQFEDILSCFEKRQEHFLPTEEGSEIRG